MRRPPGARSPGASVRISLASPEADLAAAVWPGVETIYYPRAESVEQIQLADALITGLEQRRGIRPGTVGVVPLIESPTGVAMAHEIAASSPRVGAFGVGPNIAGGLGLEPNLAGGPGGGPGCEPDALIYARAECELAARALGLEPTVVGFVLD